jgi:hypothetical protein
MFSVLVLFSLQQNNLDLKAKTGFYPLNNNNSGGTMACVGQLARTLTPLEPGLSLKTAPRCTSADVWCSLRGGRFGGVELVITYRGIALYLFYLCAVAGCNPRRGDNPLHCVLLFKACAQSAHPIPYLGPNVTVPNRGSPRYGIQVASPQKDKCDP